MRNLGIREEPKNLHNVYIAPHHWAFSQLKYFDANNAKPSTTYLPKATMDSIAHVTDERDAFKDEKGNIVYFQTPNCPQDIWTHEAKSLAGARSERIERRSTSSEKAEKKRKGKARAAEIIVEKEAKRRNQERDKLKNVWEWQEEIKRLKHEIETRDAMLESKDADIESKDTELESIKLRLDATRKELQLSRKNHARAKAKSPVPDVVTERNTDSCKCSTDVLAMVSRLIVQWGGISRLTITSSEWHAQHPEAAPILFGFEDWKETYLYIKSYFPDVNIQLKGKIACNNKKDSDIVIVPRELTDFERCLACKIFFQSMPHRGKVAVAFGVSDDVIGHAVDEWGARWGKAGEQQSVLVMTREYLKKECPDEYVAQGYPDNAVLKDGKAFVTHYKRNDGTLQRLQQNSKVIPNWCRTGF